MQRSVLFFSLFFFISPLLANKQPPISNLTVYLKQPTYQDGILFTDQGGVIEGKGIRIQAKEIEYVDKEIQGKRVQRAVASGDLMLDLGGKIFVGKRLEYDFISKTGMIDKGRTAFNLWYIGGKRIILNPDQTFTIDDAYLTTSETIEHPWEIQIKNVHISKDLTLTAKNIGVHAFGFPVFWLPYYKSNLHKTKESPVKYKMAWDKGQGPKFTMRYRAISWESFNLFFRFDYRFLKGPGGALESDYKSLDKRVLFQTKNYYAYDTFYNDKDPNKKRSRFRIQGLYDSISLNEKNIAHIRWDKISDKNMPGDFKVSDFELNTEQRTQILLRHFEKNFIVGLNFRPRINSFQGFKQELPTVSLDFKPFEIGNSGVVFDNRFKAAFLNYTYSDDIQNAISDFSSGRFLTKNSLYRSFHFKGLNITPSLEFEGVYYSDNKQHLDVFQTVFHYDLFAVIPFIKRAETYVHKIEPYIAFKGLSAPTVAANSVFIFGIQDGFHKLHEFQCGVKNVFYTKESYIPKVKLDLYAIGFLGDQTFHKMIPKTYGHFEWNQSTFTLSSLIGWNHEKNILDRANIALAWTFNENHALSLEYRHRSRFDWRKDDPNNYILDVTRPIEELLNSPLSDGRNTILSKAQFKIAPEWIFQGEAHFGWGRKDEPNYFEAKIDLITMISSAWRLKLSYLHTIRDDQFKVNFMIAQY